MPTVALTDSNRAFIKAALRTALPSVKSAHLTEAIAASLGYKTHAALLADPACASLPVKVVQGVDCDFRRRLTQLAGLSVAPGVYSTVLRSSEMPDPICRVFTRNDVRGRERWYYDCVRRNMPYVHIERRRTLTRLEWDCISVDASCDGAIREDRILIPKMFRAFQVTASRKGSIFTGSAFYGEVEGLLFNEALLLAENIALALHGAILQKNR